MPTIALAFFIFVGLLIPPSAYAAFGAGEPTLFNPDIFTDQSSSLRIDGPTGALTQRIQIAIPAGRNGLQPDIALDYNSQRTEDGIAGYGWNLSIPYIQRFNKTGSQDLYASNVTFSSSLDGELVRPPGSSGAYRARIDSGAANSYTLSANMWTMYDKKGTRYLFGADDAGRQYDSASTSVRTYTWMLQEIRDTNNNYVTFNYTRDGNQLYPSQVSYTGNGSTQGPFAITFTKSARPDVRENFKAGFKVTTGYRITQINALIASSTVGVYTLSYGYGSNGKRSLLTSVQQQGYDESSNLITLPATTFSYASSSAMFVAPGNGGGIQLKSQAHLPADTNGNGLNDVNYFYITQSDATSSQMFIDQTTTVNSIMPPEYAALDYGSGGTLPLERGVRYIDVNGDGKSDLVRGFKDANIGVTWANLHINNYTPGGSYGWTASTSYNGSIPIFGFTSGLYTLTAGVFGELNADGLPDFVMDLRDDPGIQIYLGNGSAWTPSNGFGPPFSFYFPDQPSGWQLLDVNGDGLDDWMYNGTKVQFRLNNGTGWETSDAPQWSIGTTTTYEAAGAYYDRGMRFMDLNGDGLVDFVRSYLGTGCPENGNMKTVLLNTGNGWATSTAYTLPAYTTVCDTSIFSHQEYGNWIGNGQMNQDVIKFIAYPKGSTKSVVYTPSAQLGGNPELPVSLLVVSEVGENDGFGTVSTTTYAYGGGKLHLASGIRERKFAGFAVATTTAPDSVAVTYYNQGDGTNTAIGEQSDGFALTNRPFRKDILDLSGGIKRRTYTRWDSFDTASSTFVGLGRELTFDYGAGGAHRDRDADYAYASTTNDLVRTIEYGEVAGSSNGTFTDSGSDKRTTVLTYVASSTVNMSLPRSKTVFDNGGATTTDDKYYYDTLGFGSVTKGNQTKVERLKSGSTYVSDQKAYNAYGLPTSSTDPRGKVTTYTYDARNIYIATSTNPLSQTTQFYYDYTLGKPKQTIDPNGRVFETVYDGVDRPLTEKQPDIASPGTLVTKKTYAYTDTIGSRKVAETNYLDGSTDFTIHTYLDGLDRAIQTRKEAENSNEFSVKDFVYDTAGLLWKESLPYFSSGSARTSATGNTNLYSTYTYDALKRVLSVATVVGNTTSTYDRWTTTVVDALSNFKDFTYDAFGRLAQVVEDDNGANYTTSYEYSTTDNLTKVTDADANVRNFTYDALGRRLTAQDLHDAGDGTFGTWTYTYDASGNLASTTDPKSQQTDYTYDDLNRVLTENYTGGAGTEVQYAYDTCAEGKPRLCTATSTGAVTKFTYNALGLTANETKSINGTNYVTSYSYDRQGNMTGIVYPDNSEVQYTYNTAGLLETIAQKESGGSFANLANDFDYAPTEKVQYKALANGVESTYTFNPDALYRLTNIVTTAPTGGGGGGMGFADNPWKTLARAVEELPLVVKLALDLPEELFETQEELLSEDPPVEAPPVEEITIEEPAQEVVEETVAVPVDAPSLVELSIEALAHPSPDAAAPAGTVRALIAGKTPLERASIKGREMAKLGHLPRGPRKDRDIEIVSIEPIEGGVQAFVRAWQKDGTQIGFGPDGSVDMERFRIFNPPVLVEDPSGDIVRTWKSPREGTEEKEFRFREDPKEALFAVIEHNLSVMPDLHSAENIVPGKEGKTTDTFFPDANPESASMDGTNAYYGTPYSTAHDASSGNSVDDSSTGAELDNLVYGGSNYIISRLATLFDTSPIQDSDSIDSATMSMWAYYYDDNSSKNVDNDSASLIASTPASNTALVNGDYDQYGTTKLASDIAFSSITLDQYFTFTLNGTGLSSVAKSGVTKLGLRTANDIAAAEPTGLNLRYIRMADYTGTTQDPKLVVTHTDVGNLAPLAPTALLAEGATNPGYLSDSTPELSAIYNDQNESDVATSYQIQIATSTAFLNFKWDSGKTALASSTPQGTRIADISYAGSTLASSTTYYWRIKFWDTLDTAGAWSIATSTFKLSPGPGEPIFFPTVQNISLTYDAVGNITGVTDTSDTGTGKTVVFGYDDLYRLTTASTTAATSTPYLRTYTYSKLGNMTNASNLGSYTYAETGYANPHAPTTIAGVTYAYDNNGNMTSGGGRTYTWDYRNRLVSVAGSATSTFGYDHTMNRVWRYDGTATTTFPNKYYNIATSSASIVKHVFTPAGELVATLAGGSAGAGADTGMKTTGTVESSTGWSNFTTTRINTSDNSRAACDSTCDNSDNAQTSDYSFGIASGATINGIEVKVEGNESISTGTIPLHVSLSWNDDTSWTSVKTATVDGTTDATYTLGGAADTWGRSWTDAELTNGTFRAKFDKQATSDTLNIDLIQIKVYYTSQGTASTTTRYIHTDWLGTTNVVTDSQGNTLEVSDPYPYGAERIAQTYGAPPEQRKFAGTERQYGLSLDYMVNRFYSPDRGQFISQDPVFWENQNLADPQSFNSYSYAQGNPIRNSDPTGRGILDLVKGAASGLAKSISDTVSSLLNPSGTLGGIISAVTQPKATARSISSSIQSYSSAYSNATQNQRDFMAAEAVFYFGGVPALGAAGTATKIGTAAKVSNTVIAGERAALPGHVLTNLQRYEAGGWQKLPELGTPDVFRNSPQLLPPQAAGYYTKYYAGPRSGPDRFVRGAEGELYYTGTHYGQSGTPPFINIPPKR